MKVKIFTLPECVYCKQAKAFFKENKVEYEEVNVEDNEDALKEMEELSGARSTPVIVIGEKVIIGFDEEKLKEALKL